MCTYEYDLSTVHTVYYTKQVQFIILVIYPVILHYSMLHYVITLYDNYTHLFTSTYLETKLAVQSNNPTL